MMELQWYPGHMTKALRAIKEDIKLIDIVLEMADARFPLASRNPDIDGLSNGKAHLLILGKSDLSDAEKTKKWIRHFEGQGITATSCDARRTADIKEIRKKIDIAAKEKRERDRKRGIKNRPLRALVCGIPNIGKSTLINSFAGRASAKTGNRPGVTKGKQWIRLPGDIELLDTPGLLWPRFEDQNAAALLAAAGTIREEILPLEELSEKMYFLIREAYPGRISERYGISEELSAGEVLYELARERNLLSKGAEPDTNRAARVFLDDIRSGALGRMTMEECDE